MEVEAKILDIDPEKVVVTLERLGATKLFDGEMQTTFYDTPDEAIKKKKDLLRLRRHEEETTLTYKRHLTDGLEKVREEHETRVGSFDEMDSILRHLGYKPSLTMRKRRTSYQIFEARVEIDVHLDDFAFIPPLLEIEIDDDEILLKIAAALGYSKKNLVPWDFFTVARHYGYEKS
jgi:predicted adenylyl cyclase CyaB